MYETVTSVWAYLPALLFLVLFLMPGRLLKLASGKLVITDKRIVGKVGAFRPLAGTFGIFRPQRIAFAHKELETAVVNRDLLGMVFNYGTLTVSGSNSGKIRFYGIKNPKDVRTELEKAAEIAVLGHVLPRDDDPLPPLQKRTPSPSATALPVNKPRHSPTPQDPNVW